MGQRVNWLTKRERENKEEREQQETEGEKNRLAPDCLSRPAGIAVKPWNAKSHGGLAPKYWGGEGKKDATRLVGDGSPCTDPSTYLPASPLKTGATQRRATQKTALLAHVDG
jgi:hypothetical protein